MLGALASVNGAQGEGGSRSCSNHMPAVFGAVGLPADEAPPFACRCLSSSTSCIRYPLPWSLRPPMHGPQSGTGAHVLRSHMSLPQHSVPGPAFYGLILCGK